MRSSDQEIIDFLNQLMQLGNEIISETDIGQRKALLGAYVSQIKDLIEWPHQKQINPLITMRIKNIDVNQFAAYLNDLPMKSSQFLFFQKGVNDREAFINKEIDKIKLGLEAIRYFYKNK